MGSGRFFPALRLPKPDPAAYDRLLALVDDFNPQAVDEPDPQTLRIFFSSAADRDAAGLALTRHADADAGPDGPACGFTGVESIDVPDENWAERSQAALGAIAAGGITVAPPWDMPPDAAGLRTIVIRPSMGFGTGHHATTRLCLRALLELPIAAASVIDVGTGSGVLAIAAARLGAAQVLAIDTDPDAIDSARENLTMNGVEDCVTLAVRDVRDRFREEFDLVTANLTGALLRAASERLLRLTRVGGHLVLGGFTLDEEDAVAGAFSPPARMIARNQEDEWCVLTLRRDA